MKKMLFLVGTALLRNWLLPGEGENETGKGGPVKVTFNRPYLSQVARAYSWIFGLAYVFSLFFVAGGTMAIYAAAASFENASRFAPGQVFYTGLFLCVASALAVIVCLLQARRHVPDPEKLYIRSEPEAEPPHFPLEILRLAQPVLLGLFAAWSERRQTRRAARGEKNTPAGKMAS